MVLDSCEEYIRQKTEKSQKNAEIWLEIEDLYSKKLWHPLSLRIKELIADQDFFKQENTPKKEFYENIVREIELRVAPKILAEIATEVVPSHETFEAKEEFLSRVKSVVYKRDERSISGGSIEATVICLSALAEVKLVQKNDKGFCVNIKQVTEILDEAEKLISELSTVVGPVHARFYQALSHYLREKGEHGAYYREALRYIGCSDLSKISNEEKQREAIYLVFAAVLATDVYNFGELLIHPLIGYLKTGKEPWMWEMLQAFSTGDIARFEAIRPRWSRWPDLKKSSQFLEEKIRIMCLVELAFSRTSVSNTNHLTFDTIAKAAKVPEDGVEILVMKALSLGLIRGKIDQITRSVNIIWVQPRVLGPEQVAKLSETFAKWSKNVTEVSQNAELKAPASQQYTVEMDGVTD